MSDMENKVIGIGVSLFILGVILPLGLVELANANLTGVNASVATVVTVLLPILAVIGVAKWFIKSD